MQKLAYGALLIGALVACGGNKDNKTVVVVPDMGSGTEICNPVAQTGCAAGQKCSWVNDTASVGHIDCITDGSVALNGDCMFGSDGPTTGFDNCVKGTVCISDKCETICDNNAGATACSTGFACGIYSGLFEVNGDFEAGACDKTCDPLNDNSFGSGGTGDVIPVKTGTTCGSNQGCYGFPSDTDEITHFTCTGEVNHSLVNRSACTMADGCGPDSASVYINGCAQGYVPALLDGAVGSTQGICAAFCAPQNCWMGNCGAGNTNARGSGAHACVSAAIRNDASYTTFSDASESNSCYYSWALGEVDTQNTLHMSPTSDTVGFCLDHAKYKVDSNGDGTITDADATMPNCDALPGSGSGLYGLDAVNLGCTDTTQAMAAGDLFQNHKKASPVLMDLPRMPSHMLAKRTR